MFISNNSHISHFIRNIHDHINQPCAGLGCVENEFPWKPHRIEFCASINNYPQSADRLYFSCVSTVNLSLYQLYFSHCINCIFLVYQLYISHYMSCIYLVYQHYISHCISCISLTVLTVFLSQHQLYFSHSIDCTSHIIYWWHISYRVEFWAGINNYPQSVDRAPGGCNLTVTTSTQELLYSLLYSTVFSVFSPGGCDLTVTTSTREIIKFSYPSYFSSSSSL